MGEHGETKGMAGLTARAIRAAAKMRADLPLAFFDVLVVAALYTAVLLLRFDGAVPPKYWDGFSVFLPIALSVHLTANGLAGLYGRVWLHAGVREAQRILWAAGGAGVALSAFLLPSTRIVPASVVVLGAALAPTLLGGLRFQSRLFALRRSQAAGVTTRVVVVGAGEAGFAVIRDMQRDPEAGLQPIAVLDEDPRKQGRDVSDVPVVGGLDRLWELSTKVRLDMVLLAIPSADRRLVRRVVEAAERASLPVKVLPRVSELVGGQVGVRDVRDLDISDLLGREQVVTDLDGVRSILAGRRVLVTGAGGSIGSEIARQVMACGPARLVLLDHDETHLHDVSARLGGQAVQVLADIRDPGDVASVFETHRPEVVFHAAAHKHVPLLESHPSEAVRTNVRGAENVAREAALHGTDRFVFVSTDKAVQPRSIMGASKRLGELIVQTYAPPGTHWCAVRFGNVLGSRGSVVPTFMRQIREGGPVTVTDPDMTRFFMSIEEAVQLVLQAAVFASEREIFMLDMGEPVRIMDLAERMIRLSGQRVGDDISIQITGLRPGEKLVEELRNPDEVATTTPHPSIIALHPASLDIALMERLPDLLHHAQLRDDEAARKLLVDLTALPAETDGEVTLPPVGS